MTTKTAARWANCIPLDFASGERLWDEFPHYVRRLEAQLTERVPTYGELSSNPAVWTAEQGAGNCYTSDVTWLDIVPNNLADYARPDAHARPHESWHLPVLDIDDPDAMSVELDNFLRKQFQANIFWERSSNNWHVYVQAAPFGTSLRAMPWETYSRILSYLAHLGITDSYWTRHSIRDERSVVRKPSARKGKGKADNPCMWCGQVFQTADERDDHEEGCG